MGDDSQLTQQALERLVLTQGQLLDLLFNQLARHQQELAADLLEDIAALVQRSPVDQRLLLEETMQAWRQAHASETRLRQAELRNSSRP